MSAHTPGPWFVEHTGQGLRVVHGEPNASGFRDDVRFHAVTGIATDEEKANARLVANAPELLKVLDTIADADDASDLWNLEMFRTRLREVCQMAADAVAKVVV